MFKLAWEKLGSTTVGGSSDPVNNSWKELGRTTLGSDGDSINVSFTAKDNLMILQNTLESTTIQARSRVNSDSASNYASRQSADGGTDYTNTSRNVGFEYEDGSSYNNSFSVHHITNIASQEKLGTHSWVASDTGAGNAPHRVESVGKWANTSNAITSWDTINYNSGGDFTAGSEVVVLGCDNDEADSGTNFWQQLADVELTSSSTTIDSGTFTAKKYLWIQFYGNQSTGSSDSLLRFNSDSGSNYARRFSTNGGTDSTSISATSISNMAGSEGNRDPFYSNMFIINKSDKEKLVIGELIFAETGAGAGNAPARREWVAKWTNTSAQITQSVLTSSSNYDTGSYIKVWGSD